MRHLINDDGTPFESSELQTLHSELDALDNNGRSEYRNQNASVIAKHSAGKFLIVSGPGTGKSTLFKGRISFWLEQDSTSKILCLTFVRKLVADLDSDIQGDENLTQAQKDQVEVHTLHKFARSIVEQNHGTTEWRFQPHFRIIGQSWKDVVWGDVLAFHAGLDPGLYSWKKFEEQLHNADFDEAIEWQNLKETYFKLCRFFNAAGFADLILRAKDALAENTNLNESDCFIIDEYQDFNAAEDALINQLVNNPRGLLVVGDDEQVLYEKLKSGKPNLIRNLYRNNDYANGMLPFCGRSSFHITRSAGHFIQQNRDTECIEKIYLPIKTDDDKPKVQVIACATAPTAVDYIEKFVADNKTAIGERKAKLAEGKEKDAFLLILTPAKEVNFYGESKKKITNIAAEYQAENRYFSEDYYKILSYYSLANNPQNNFTFRKVLHYENIAMAKVHELIKLAMQKNQNSCDLEVVEVKNATQKTNDIKTILEAGDQTIGQKIESLAGHISLSDKKRLKEDIERKAINQEEVTEIEHQEEEEAELEEIEVKKMGAIELMTIVGSKGLSADHVIIIGFDNVNMSRVTKNAFYVAMTRARKSLHILTALKSGGARQAHDFLEQLPDEHAEYFSYKKSNHTKSQLQGKQGFKDYLNSLNSMSQRRS
ncbi:MAG: ATP-dependent helicase [Candidatus Chaera renei]|uniref:DNA 3'-5' helicase n=1 Tax=Candidatus Chaera renei TaxID=2506947 RepID=A0A4Q0AKM8_9BACT|nr:MAG: ATP-dependent helicase [Candidatus Chaera renei]